MRTSVLAVLLLSLRALTAGPASAQPSGAAIAPADRTLTTAVDQLQAGDPLAALTTLQPLRERRDAPAAAFDLLLALSEAYGVAGGGADGAGGAERTREESIVRYVARAEALLLRRHPQDAIESLPFIPEASRGIEQDRLRRVAGRAALLAGRLPDAIRWLSPAAEGHPATTLALAQAHYRSGAGDHALALLEPFARAIVDQPAEPPNRGLAVSILLEVGRISSSTGKAALAIPYLERASALSPNAAPIWQTLAQALLAAGRREDGERALARFRELSALLQGQGAAETPEQKAEREKRRSELEAALEAAVALARSGKPDEAIAAARAQMQAAPAEVEPHLFVITVLVSRNRLDEALAACESAATAFPQHPEVLYHRAVVHLRRGDTAAAEKDLRLTLASAPNHVLALNNLAVLLEQRHATAEAITLLERVLAVDVENTVARENLARLREKKPG